MIEVGGSKSLGCRAFPSNRCISDANTSSNACTFNKTKKVITVLLVSDFKFGAQLLDLDLRKRQCVSPYMRSCFPFCFPRDVVHPVPFDPKNVGRLLQTRRCRGRGGDDGLCSSVNLLEAAFCFVFLNLSSVPLCLVLSFAILLHFGPLSAGIIKHHVTYENQNNIVARSSVICFMTGIYSKIKDNIPLLESL